MVKWVINFVDYSRLRTEIKVHRLIDHQSTGHTPAGHEKSACVCLYIVFYSIEHVYRHLRVVFRFIYWWEFIREFFEIFRFLDHYCYVFWVWEMSDLSLGSSDHCFFHHSIIGDTIIFYYYDIGWIMPHKVPLMVGSTLHPTT